MERSESVNQRAPSSEELDRLRVVTIAALLVERAISVGPVGATAVMRVPPVPLSPAGRQGLMIEVRLPATVEMAQLREIERDLRGYADAHLSDFERQRLELQFRYRFPIGMTVRLTA